MYIIQRTMELLMRILFFAKKIKEFEHNLSTELNNLISDLDISLNLSQIIVLWNIYNFSALGCKNNYERGCLTHTINKLFNSGLITKEGVIVNDKRRIKYSITPKGKAIIKHLNSKMNKDYYDTVANNLVEELKNYVK